MATPNEKEDAEVYPVVILDPNSNEYTKGIAAWLTTIAEQNPQNLVCIARTSTPRCTGAIHVRAHAVENQRHRIIRNCRVLIIRRLRAVHP